MSPGTQAGLLGMGLVAALYVAHSVAVRASGQGLGLPWLALLLVPGAAAAHICSRRGMRSALEKEGVRAGLVAAHFVGALNVSVLALAVLTTDWARYAQEVGPQVADAVRAAALPAAIALALVTLAVTYASLALAGWLGALAYRVLGSAGKKTKN